MHVINARNVCEALPLGIDFLKEHGVQQESRNGPVLVAPYPVTTVYERPQERVLFASARDANPFFHLAESIWMLRGSNDSKPLDYFVHDFGMRYAESDGHLHGAYGYRWRHHWGFDQLHSIIHRLTADPDDRRSVIAMWDSSIDLYCPDQPTPRDLPCNTHIYFRLHDEKLDMTICCRSNDIIWGAYGANAVHFSILQEYIASNISCDIGKMYQISNNYHAYIAELDKMERRGNYAQVLHTLYDDRYHRIHPQKLIEDPNTFDKEIRGEVPMEEEPFLCNTYLPMMLAWDRWKQNEDPYGCLHRIEADDWREACIEWITRRKKVN